MVNLEGYDEVRDELAKSIRGIENLLDSLESVEGNPEQITKDDIILYFGNLAKVTRINLNAIDKILKASSELEKKIILNQKVTKLVLDMQPVEVKKKAKKVLKT
jgi:hypothetical protein